MSKRYTVGEVFRGGLLLTKNGKPYTDKATVLRVCRMLPSAKYVQTPWGRALTVTQGDITKHNARIETYAK